MKSNAIIMEIGNTLVKLGREVTPSNALGLIKAGGKKILGSQHAAQRRACKDLGDREYLNRYGEPQAIRDIFKTDLEWGNYIIDREMNKNAKGFSLWTDIRAASREWKG